MTARFRWIAICLILALVPILHGCAGSAGKSDERLTNVDLTIVSFGSIHGELAPCG